MEINHDFHHAAHLLATGESDGYYLDDRDGPAARFARCLAEGFAYQGGPSRPFITIFSSRAIENE